MKHELKLFKGLGIVLLNGIVSLVLAGASFFVILVGCEELDDDLAVHEVGPAVLPLENVALLLSGIPLGADHLREVHDAVSSSSCNGYDEEYMMRDLFTEPGAGVGNDRLPSEAADARRRARAVGAGADSGYPEPLKELIETRLRSGEMSSMMSKSGGVADILGGMTVDEYLEALKSSDIQIYWPYSEEWDGETPPVITFDPMDGGSVNVGYRLGTDPDGNPSLVEMLVDEGVARRMPVWVVNRNDDSEHTSLELLRMRDPDWGNGGGDIVVTPRGMTCAAKTATEGRQCETLVLKDFTMKRNFDSWFAGASEFFVKIGSVEGFTASTEAELQLYTPTITDFMIVIKRKYVGVPQPFNAVLVSDWTEQLTHCAFMVIEDDGGRKDSWKCSAMVKYNSKSYGFEVSLPVNTRDDIVWRGQLGRNYILANNGRPSHFGDVDITFEIVGQ